MLVQAGRQNLPLAGIFALQQSDFPSHRNFHLRHDLQNIQLVYCLKNARVDQRVTDLVGPIVFTTGIDVAPALDGLLLGNFRHWVRQCKDDGFGLHLSDPLLLERVPRRNSNKNVSIIDGILERTPNH